MEIVSRKEFRDKFSGVFNEIIRADHPLWIPEREFEPKTKCIKFILTKKINFTSEEKYDYWEWCNSTLNGVVRCFSSGDEDEWWGFSNSDDVVIWTLRWAK
jgi:hypothetical protein